MAMPDPDAADIHALIQQLIWSDEVSRVSQAFSKCTFFIYIQNRKQANNVFDSVSYGD